MWIFPKIANFGVFDRFLAKNTLELSGGAVPTEHQIPVKGVIFGNNFLNGHHGSKNWKTKAFLRLK